MGMKKNILVVDDSALMRRVICDIINTDSTFQATDVCRDGLEAYEKLKKNKYDGVVLDINMPRMNGLELLERLQKEKIKATVIMVSTMTTKDAEVTILALELGAIDFVTKPDNVIEAKGDAFKKKLLDVLKAVLKTEQFRRSTFTSSRTSGISARTAATSTRVGVSARTAASARPAAPTRPAVNNIKGHNKIVALACSTGGPKALQSVIPFLPKNLDAPIVLVQHMPAGFTKSMADRLNETSAIKVKEAAEGDVLEKGVVYVAPGGKHMEVKKTAGGHMITLNNMPAIGGLRPCADITYDSLKQSGFDQVVCVVLTGMGADGTKGILSLEKSKPIYVISQDAESCIVYGMPKAIAEAGVVNEVVPLDKVAATITKNVGVR